MPAVLLGIDSDIAAALDKLIHKPANRPRLPFADGTDLMKLKGEDKKNYEQWKKDLADFQKRPYKTRDQAINTLLRLCLFPSKMRTPETIEEPNRG